MRRILNYHFRTNVSYTSTKKTMTSIWAILKGHKISCNSLLVIKDYRKVNERLGIRRSSMGIVVEVLTRATPFPLLRNTSPLGVYPTLKPLPALL